MIQDLDKTLAELLKHSLPSELAEQVSISFATPDASFLLSSPKLPAINLFLYNIQENREWRSNEWLIERKGTTITKQRPPVRVDCSYLITVWSSETVRYPTQEEHRILGEVMRVLLRYRKLPAEILQGSLKGQEPPLRGKILQSSQLQSLGEIWQAMGGKPRAILQCLEELVIEGTFDLVCAPDIMRFPEADRGTLQKEILDYCDREGNIFAILDALPDADVKAVLEQQEKLGSCKNGALYYPWVLVVNLEQKKDKNIWVPPCGHVAGIYARSDLRVGVHKAPANEELSGVQDLRVQFTQRDIKQLNPAGVNCLCAFPGRGIRVWGARTLSQEKKWRYVNVRRLFHHVSRWIERFMIKITFEPNDERLRARIVRELTFYFEGLFSQGALKGATAEQAFYIKCDAENNPREVSDAGMVITEIGLAPTIPSEFIVVRITHDDSGVRIVQG